MVASHYGFWSELCNAVVTLLHAASHKGCALREVGTLYIGTERG